MKIIKLKSTMELKEMQVNKISKNATPIITLNVTVDFKVKDMAFTEALRFEVSATRFNVVLRSNHNLRELEIFTETMKFNIVKSNPVHNFSIDVCNFATELLKAHETLQIKKEVNKSI